MMVWAWMQENASGLQVITGSLTVLIWLIYLHMIFLGFLKQRRSSLLIARSGRRDLKADCLVSNMGMEPTYILDVLAEIDTGEVYFTASVIEWEGEPSGEDEVPPSYTVQGPLSSGDHFILGTFENLIIRAETHFGQGRFAPDVKSIFLIVLASTNQARHIVAACRKFEVAGNPETGLIDLRPVEVEAYQIRSGRKRRKLNGILRAFQRQEAMQQSMHDTIFGSRRDRLGRWLGR
jgi:hypothetical protein